MTISQFQQKQILKTLEMFHPSMRRHGSFAHWIRVAAGLGRDDAVVVDVQRGDRLPRREGFAGAIVTGSAAMVTERQDWSERSAGWLRGPRMQGSRCWASATATS